MFRDVCKKRAEGQIIALASAGVVIDVASFVAFEFAKNFCWYSNCYSTRWNICEKNGVGADSGMVANMEVP